MTARLAKKIIQGHVLGLRAYKLSTYMRAVGLWCLLACLLLCGCTQPLVVSPERPKDQYDVDESDWALSEAEFKKLQDDLREEIRKRKDAEEKASHEPREAPAPVVDLSAVESKLDAILAAQQKPVDVPLPKDTAAEKPVKSVAPAAEQFFDVWAKTQANCPPCVTYKGERDGVRINGLRVRWNRMEDCPKQFTPTGYPFFVWVADGQYWHRNGWWGVENFEGVIDKTLKGEIPRTTGQAKPVYGSGAVARTVEPATCVYVEQVYEPVVYAAPVLTGYPIRADWAFDRWQERDASHLINDLNHAGKFDYAWVLSLSVAERASLHADDHEGRVQWAYVVRP